MSKDARNAATELANNLLNCFSPECPFSLKDELRDSLTPSEQKQAKDWLKAVWESPKFQDELSKALEEAMKEGPPPHE